MSSVAISRVLPLEASPAENSETDHLIVEQLVTAPTPLSSSCRASETYITPSTKAQSGLTTSPRTNPLLSISKKDNETATASPTTPTQLCRSFQITPSTDPKTSVSKEDNEAAIPPAISASKLCRSPEQVPTRTLQKDDLHGFGSYPSHFPPVTNFGTDQRDAISTAVRQTFTGGNAEQRDKPSTLEYRAAALLQDIHEQEAHEAGAAALLAFSRRAESENDSDDEEEPNVIDSAESPIYCHGNNLRLKATEGNALWALSRVPRNDVNLPLGTTNHEGETECSHCTIVNAALTHHRYLRGYTKCKDCRDLARSKPNCKDCKNLPNVDKRSARENTISLADTARNDLNGKKTWGAASYDETHSHYIIQDQTLDSRQDQQYPESQCRLEPYTSRQLVHTRTLFINNGHLNNGHLNKPTPTLEPAAVYPLPSPDAIIEDVEQSTKEAAPALILTPLTEEATPAATPTSPENKTGKKSPLVPGTQQACLEVCLYADERVKQGMHVAVYCNLHELDRDEYEKGYQQRLIDAGVPTPEQRKRDTIAMEREAKQDIDSYLKQVYSEERTAAALYGLPMEPVRVDDGPTNLRKAKGKAKKNPLKELESTLLVAPPPAFPATNGPRAYTSRHKNVIYKSLDLDDNPKYNNSDMTQRKNTNAAALDRDIEIMNNGGFKPIAAKRRHDIAMDPDNININAFVETALPSKKRKVSDKSTVTTTTAATHVSNDNTTTTDTPAPPPTKKIKITLKVNPKANPAHPDHTEFMAPMGKKAQNVDAHAVAGPELTPTPANARLKRTLRPPKNLGGDVGGR